MNKLIITGNLTKDPESRITQRGETVCNFTVAVSRTRNGEPATDYFRCGVWGRQAESCQKYLHKGDRCSVVGSVMLNMYEDENGKTLGSMQVNATEVEFLTNPER